MPKRGRTSDPPEPVAHDRRQHGSLGSESRTIAVNKADPTTRPSKRSKSSKPTVVTLEGALSEEILLLCLSFLEVDDLLVLARVSSSWNRLTEDPELWRRLYLATFPSAASRSPPPSSPLGGRTRPWRMLFKISSNWRRGTARPTTLSSSVRQSVLAEAPTDLAIVGESPTTTTAAPATRLPSPARTPRPTLDTILAFHKSFYITASRKASAAAPTVSVHQTTPAGASLLIGTVSSPSVREYYISRPHFKPGLSVTELRLDDRPSAASAEPSLRLLVFFSTGQYALFHIRLPTATSSFLATELFSSLALASTLPFLTSTIPTSFDPVVLAKFHSPLLVTCSSAFNIRFWRVAPVDTEVGQPAKVTVTEARPSMQSRETWWPVVLTLAPFYATPQINRDLDDSTDEWEQAIAERMAGKEADERFKVTLAYSTPVFPSAWSVGVQEFIVTAPRLSPFQPHVPPRQPRMTITARHATAPRAHASTVLNARQRWTSSHDDGLVTAIEHADPWIVTSRSDNTIDVYEVVDDVPPAASRTSGSEKTIRTSSVLPSRLGVVHRRTLFGHTASVSSVAVDEEGRCVSGGVDGRVRVWDVGGRQDSGLAIRDGSEEAADAMSWADIRTGASGRGAQPGSRIKRVLFDEEKIVSIVEEQEEESVRVLRFD